LIAAFSFPMSSHAVGLGWYFESVSWKDLQSYFGKGTPKQTDAFLKDMEAFIEEEKKDKFFGLRLSERNINLWRSLIRTGPRYDTLTNADAVFLDRVISLILSPGMVTIEALDVQGETSPDFISSHVMRKLFDHSSGEGKRLLSAFRFGRSYGEIAARDRCFKEPAEEASVCLGAYVLLSPRECATLGKELKRILELPALAGEKRYVTDLADALVSASTRGRGMYIHASD
jgi:hypothetical protein